MFKNLTSETIGAIKTWVIVTMGVVIVMLVFWVLYLKLSVIPILQSEKKTLEATIKEKETLINVQNVLAEVNATDPKKVEQLPIRITRIDKEFIPVYETIEKWRESNETYDYNRSSKLYDVDFAGLFNGAITAADRESSAEMPLR